MRENRLLDIFNNKLVMDFESFFNLIDKDNSRLISRGIDEYKIKINQNNYEIILEGHYEKSISFKRGKEKIKFNRKDIKIEKMTQKKFENLFVEKLKFTSFSNDEGFVYKVAYGKKYYKKVEVKKDSIKIIFFNSILGKDFKDNISFDFFKKDKGQICFYPIVANFSEGARKLINEMSTSEINGLNFINILNEDILNILEMNNYINKEFKDLFFDLIFFYKKHNHNYDTRDSKKYLSYLLKKMMWGFY